MKVLQLTGSAVLALALAGCGGGSSSTAPAADSSALAASPAAVESSAAPAAEASPAAAASPSAVPSTSTSTAPSTAPSAAPSVAATVAAVAQAAAAPPASFAICKACHAVEPGKNGIGPSLAGIYGTRAGEVAGYEFSDAMTNSGLVWNEATLDKYLTAPQQVVPGTKMSYGGQKDPAKRAEIIAYLKSLK